MVRKCYKCKTQKKLEEFRGKNGSPQNKDYICKKCVNEYNKELRAKKRKDAPFKNRTKKYPDWVLILRNRGNKKSIKSQISSDFLLNLYKSQNGKCFYSNLEMDLDLTRKNLKNISIDRVDSNIGYTPENVVLCCLGINLAKNSFSLNDFNLFLKELKTV